MKNNQQIPIEVTITYTAFEKPIKEFMNKKSLNIELQNLAYAMGISNVNKKP